MTHILAYIDFISLQQVQTWKTEGSWKKMALHGGLSRMLVALQSEQSQFLGACVRPDCRYAHSSDSVPTDAHTVRLCMDSVRGRCLRSPCRYYHAPGGGASGLETSAGQEDPVGSVLLLLTQ